MSQLLLINVSFLNLKWSMWIESNGIGTLGILCKILLLTDFGTECKMAPTVLMLELEF